MSNIFDAIDNSGPWADLLLLVIGVALMVGVTIWERKRRRI
jgi:hypothetical protein